MAKQSEFVTVTQAAAFCNVPLKELSRMAARWDWIGDFIVRAGGRRYVRRAELNGLKDALSSLGFPYACFTCRGFSEPALLSDSKQHQPMVEVEVWKRGRFIEAILTPEEAVALADELLKEACEAEELAKSKGATGGN